MKRILTVAITILLFLAPGIVLAAGTVTVTRDSLSADRHTLVIKLACIGDSSNGSVPATALTQDAISENLGWKYWTMGFFLYEIWVVSGSPSPDAADISVTDSIASELYAEENIIPASGTSEGTITRFRTVTKVLTVTVSNQSTSSAQWDIYIKLVR